MAKIVLGVGASHSPLLVMRPEDWSLRAIDDRKNPAHPFRGNVYTFDELVKLRGGEGLDREIKPEVMQERHVRNQEHLNYLSDRIVAAEIDVLVIFGDDQKEILLNDNNPPFLIFTGAEIPFKPTSPERRAAMSEAIRVADRARTPDQELSLKGAPELASHIVEALKEAFDVSVAQQLLAKPGGGDSIGHAFGFFYHRLLDDLERVPGMATLPVLINTFFPPNQPSARRVYQFGRAVGSAILGWKSDLRVGIAASGGFSHFVIDEQLDRAVINALQQGDVDAVLNQPEEIYQSGTSEIKNWIAAKGALEVAGLAFELVDYIPCYRSEAGTGNAMAFAIWD